MPTPFGYGDPSGQGEGGYGLHSFGYGHPWKILPLVVGGGEFVPDAGGRAIEADCLTPGFLPSGPLTVWVAGQIAYSGVQEQGSDVYADTAGQRFEFALPHLPGVRGLVDVRVRGAGVDYTWVGALSVVAANARTSTTMLLLRHPREVWAARLPTPAGG